MSLKICISELHLSEILPHHISYQGVHSGKKWIKPFWGINIFIIGVFLKNKEALILALANHLDLSKGNFPHYHCCPIQKWQEGQKNNKNHRASSVVKRKHFSCSTETLMYVVVYQEITWSPPFHKWLPTGLKR